MSMPKQRYSFRAMILRRELAKRKVVADTLRLLDYQKDLAQTLRQAVARGEKEAIVKKCQKQPESQVSKYFTHGTESEPPYCRSSTPTTGSGYSTYTYQCSGIEQKPNNTSSNTATEHSENDVDVVFGVEDSQQEGDSVKMSGVNSTVPELPPDSPLRTQVPRGLAFGQRVRNAWRQARNSFKNERDSTLFNTTSANSPGAPFLVQKSAGDVNIVDQESNVNQQSTLEHADDHESQQMKKDAGNTGETHLQTDLLIRHNADHLVQSLKEATLQLARRDMEMQRLITVNAQLGERYCRMRTQYAELAREQARLRRRFDILLVKGMDHDHLKASKNDLETQLDELRGQLAAAEERATQNARRLTRVEAEAREVAQNATTADAQVAQLRAELQRKEAQICSLTCRRYIHAAREMQTRKIQNELMELKGNVRVLIRCHSTQDSECAFRFLTDDTMVLKPASGAATCLPSSIPGGLHAVRAYRIFQPGSTQKAIFDEVSELVTSCVDGVSIMAYGQTGTGKTYTMLGIPSEPGVIPRVARHLLVQCHQRAPLWTYRISIAIIQIYQEMVVDLLAEPNSPTNAEQLGRVTMHDNGRQILLRGAREVEVNTEQEIIEEIRKARLRRHASALLLNTSPTYLHFIVIFRVRGVCRLTKFGAHISERGISHETQLPVGLSPTLPIKQENVPIVSSRDHAKQHSVEEIREGNIPLVTHSLCILGDLAGFDIWGSKQRDFNAENMNQPNGVGRSAMKLKSRSELDSTISDTKSVQRSNRSVKTGGDNADILEAKHLGRSLITLARVFEALSVSESSHKQVHVPFRDSKLTHLLKPSLTGDAKCLLIVTINSERSNLEGTMRSLNLASRASLVCYGKVHRNAAHQGGIRTGIASR
ncbi:unnamed protein product [Dicrocoelium dendriticum]|nr:unnamed protein product [Dicrocoelium dendriticum]